MKKISIICFVLVSLLQGTFHGAFAMKRKATNDINPRSPKRRRLGDMDRQNIQIIVLGQEPFHPETPLTKLIKNNGDETQEFLCEIFKFLGAKELLAVSHSNKLFKLVVDYLLRYHFGETITLKKFCCIEPEVLAHYLSAFYGHDKKHSYDTVSLNNASLLLPIPGYVYIQINALAENDNFFRKACILALETENKSVQSNLKKQRNITEFEIPNELNTSLLKWLGRCGLLKILKIILTKHEKSITGLILLPIVTVASRNGHLDVTHYLCTKFKTELCNEETVQRALLDRIGITPSMIESMDPFEGLDRL